MTNNELLSAISDLLVQKLKAELQPIKDKMQNIDDRVQSVESELLNVDTRMQNLEAEMLNVDTRMQNLEAEMLNVNTRMQSLEAEMLNVNTRMQSLEDNVLRLGLCQENDILPRLCTIESCYTSTYNRYNSYADKMDTAFTDISLLKIVVSDHSERLQNLA